MNRNIKKIKSSDRASALPNHPHLAPLFTAIPQPSRIIEVLVRPTRGKISPLNPGTTHREILFKSPKYRLNRTEFERFLSSLNRWVEAVEEWREAAITPPFINFDELTRKRDQARAEFVRKYGKAASALWTSVRRVDSMLIPFFNPIYFPRRSREMPYFWRLVDLVNQLYMMDPVGESRGRSHGWTERDYVQIADLWFQGYGDVEIARRISSNPDDLDPAARVKRARMSMGLRRPRKT